MKIQAMDFRQRIVFENVQQGIGLPINSAKSWYMTFDISGWVHMNPLPLLGKFLVIIGLVIAAIGVLLLLSPKIPWLGRLPAV